MTGPRAKMCIGGHHLARGAPIQGPENEVQITADHQKAAQLRKKIRYAFGIIRVLRGQKVFFATLRVSSRINNKISKDEYTYSTSKAFTVNSGT